MIHELIHYLGIDFTSSDLGYSKLIKTITDIFNFDGELRPYEAYTECLATIIHSVYVGNLLNNKSLIKNILLHETNFTLFQCAKILHHIGITTFEEIIDKKR